MRVLGGYKPGRERTCLFVSYAVDSDTGRYRMHHAPLPVLTQSSPLTDMYGAPAVRQALC